jgi:hypothetical protein
MGVGDVMSLSLGEWLAICAVWDRAHDDSGPAPPSDEEFDAAVAAAQGG